MVTLVVLTAAFVAVTLVVGLVTVLIFVLQIRAFISETSTALDLVDERASRLAGHLERLQVATHAAASRLALAEK